MANSFLEALLSGIGEGAQRFGQRLPGLQADIMARNESNRRFNRMFDRDVSDRAYRDEMDMKRMAAQEQARHDELMRDERRDTRDYAGIEAKQRNADRSYRLQERGLSLRERIAGGLGKGPRPLTNLQQNTLYNQDVMRSRGRILSEVPQGGTAPAESVLHLTPEQLGRYNELGTPEHRGAWFKADSGSIKYPNLEGDFTGQDESAIDEEIKALMNELYGG